MERQQWQEQLDQDAVEMEARRAEAADLERLRQEDINKEKEEQRKEEEKKNAIKYTHIPDRDVPTQPPVIASSIATHKLEKGKYMPLWYFTNTGLHDVMKSFSIVDEDTLSLVKWEDRSMALVPSLTSKESKALVEDQSLSWEDFSIAAPHMIEAMSHTRWPNERVQMMVNFWSNLTIHPYRSSGNPLEKSTLLLYQRKLWHQAINSPGHSYNLSRINQELVKEMKDWLYWIEREWKDAERDLVSIRLYHPILSPFANTILFIYLFSYNFAPPFSINQHWTHCALRHLWSSLGPSLSPHTNICIQCTPHAACVSPLLDTLHCHATLIMCA